MSRGTFDVAMLVSCAAILAIASVNLWKTGPTWENVIGLTVAVTQACYLVSRESRAWLDRKATSPRHVAATKRCL